MTIQRVQWTCPVCQRRFAIPASAPKPSRCPECRRAEESGDQQDAATFAEVPADNPLSALAAIQMEVVEEATRGPAVRGVSAPVPSGRRFHPTLTPISTAYAVLTGLAVVGSLAALLFGLRAAFVMAATPDRTTMIFESIAAFVGGLIGALIFFTLRELIRVILDIEQNTRPK